MSQLFGFPSGLSGGSKETNYNTDYTTSRTTNYTTNWSGNKNTTYSSTQMIPLSFSNAYSPVDIGVNSHTGNHEYIWSYLDVGISSSGNSVCRLTGQVTNNNNTVRYGTFDKFWESENVAGYTGHVIMNEMNVHLTTPINVRDNMNNSLGRDYYITLTKSIDWSVGATGVGHWNVAGGWDAFLSSTYPSTENWIPVALKVNYHQQVYSTQSTSFSSSQSTSKITNYSTDYTTSHITYG